MERAAGCGHCQKLTVVRPLNLVHAALVLQGDDGVHLLELSQVVNLHAARTRRNGRTQPCQSHSLSQTSHAGVVWNDSIGNWLGQESSLWKLISICVYRHTHTHTHAHTHALTHTHTTSRWSKGKMNNPPHKTIKQNPTKKRNKKHTHNKPTKNQPINKQTVYEQIPSKQPMF